MKDMKGVKEWKGAKWLGARNHKNLRARKHKNGAPEIRNNLGHNVNLSCTIARGETKKKWCVIDV